MSVDCIIKNGRVYSVDMAGIVSRNEAIAIKDGIITAVGTNEDIGRLATTDTKIIDAEGCSVMPGFSDAHLHATFSASAMFSCNLFEVVADETYSREKLIKEYQQKMKIYMENHKEDKIIRGTGWNIGYFGTQLPTRHDLDEICPDKPMVLESFCQHHLWVNTKAIEMSEITKDTPTPRAGEVTREEDGYPAGIFSEFTALAMIKENLKGYDFSVEEYKETLRIYQREFANKYGVTLIFDAYCSENGREAYKELARNKELTIRVRGNYYADPALDEVQFDKMIDRKNKDKVEDLYDVNTVKFFIEGSGVDFYLNEPMNEEFLKAAGFSPDYTGKSFWSDEEINRYFTKLNKAGFQTHSHAMGDRAVKQTINGCEYAANHGVKNMRNVIAHIMYAQEEDIDRMGKLNIMGCVQPTWMVQEPITTAGLKYMFGEDRYLDFYPYKRLIDAGCIVSVGTDFPVTPPPDTFVEIEHALRRSVTKGARFYDEMYGNLILGPKNNPTRDCVELKDVIQGLTINSAYQNFVEDITGSIEVGKSAELVVLDRNLEETEPSDIYMTNVRYTLFKGNVVYEA